MNLNVQNGASTLFLFSLLYYFILVSINVLLRVVFVSSVSPNNFSPVALHPWNAISCTRYSGN